VTETDDYPRLAEIEATAAKLAPHVFQTPVWRWQTGLMQGPANPAREVWPEPFRRTGTFSEHLARGASAGTGA
jgi:threonine dehydratase